MRRFELPTPWSVAKCSIQLSYTHILNYVIHKITMPATGIEPVLCHHNRILSPARLPVPPRRQTVNMLFTMGRGGFEPPKQIAADLQSVPFGHSGICPLLQYKIVEADDRTRTDNLLITNQLLCQLSHIGKKWDLQGSNL